MNKILVITIFVCIFALIIYIFRVRLYNLFSKKTKTIKTSKPITNINYSTSKPITNINYSTFKPIEKYEQDISVILYYADWCNHCPAIKEWYIDLVDSSPYPNMNFTMIEESDLSPEIYKTLEGFPTILIICNEEKQQYIGDRTREDLLRYLKNLV